MSAPSLRDVQTPERRRRPPEQTRALVLNALSWDECRSIAEIVRRTQLTRDIVVRNVNALVRDGEAEQSEATRGGAPRRIRRIG